MDSFRTNSTSKSAAASSEHLAVGSPMVPAAQDDDDQHTLTLSNMAYKSAYTIEASDIEDDYDRSGYMSPSLPTDNSPTSSDGITSPDHTPTFAHGGNYTSPTGLITQWTAAQCAEYITSLGFSQHAEAMIGEQGPHGRDEMDD